jgi:hypothetical protein
MVPVIVESVVIEIVGVKIVDIGSVTDIGSVADVVIASPISAERIIVSLRIEIPAISSTANLTAIPAGTRGAAMSGIMRAGSTPTCRAATSSSATTRARPSATRTRASTTRRTAISATATTSTTPASTPSAAMKTAAASSTPAMEATPSAPSTKAPSAACEEFLHRQQQRQCDGQNGLSDSLATIDAKRHLVVSG